MSAETSVPVSSMTGISAVEFACKIIDNARFVWSSFEIKETGNKPLVLSIKDGETGFKLFKRVFTEVRYDVSALLLKANITSSVIVDLFYFLWTYKYMIT